MQTGIRIALVAAAVAMAAAPSLAQPEPTGGSSATSSSSATTSPAAARPAPAALQGQDATFLRKAAESGQMEVEQAQLALDSARSAQTRSIAAMILEDHRRSNEKLAALARSKGWSLPPAIERDSAAMKSATSPRDIDEHYVRDQIAAHREAISLFRAQVAGGSDPDLVAFARETLPTLENHLAMLQGSGPGKAH
jgi:putative membrane protein